MDVVGNIDATPAVYTWFVEPPEDGRAPITKIDSGPMPTTVDRSARFELSADLPGATYECALDNGAWLACESAFTLSGLPVGPHTLDVRATANGNRDATPARWAWRITAAPIPHELTCGEILTRSVIATNDLIDCPGNGVIIGANGVTLDLDGHTIDGIGIDGGIVNMGFDSVTIRNGFVTEFDYGVLLNPGSAKGLVTGIRAEFNQEAGIALADADEGGFGNTVRDNTVVQNKLGIALYSNTRKTLVHDNHLGGNLDDGIRLEMAHENQIYENEIATSSGFGVYVFGGHDNVVRDNELDANLGGVAVGEELIPSNRTIVERNEIVDSLADGIVVMDSADVKIQFNVVRDGGSGVIMELARNALVKGNDLSGNVTGVVVEESTDVMIDSNNASGGLGSGIEAGALSANITILNNAASGNGGEGIEISDSAPAGQGTSLMGNTADANGGDGISVEGVGHLIGGAEPEQGNTVQLNGGWGIYAVGAIDRGNNFAAGNMEPGQCFGVICRIGAPPGAPDTWIVDHPPALTSSRNASFTYNGHDEVTPLIDLVFECRLDTDDDLAWEDCEYPMQYSNLAPGHHKFEVRAIDMRGSGLADHSPASWSWTYQPGAPGDPPDTFIDLGPPAETWLPETIFTYHADEPDVTFECKVDDFPYEVCSFDELVNGPSAGWEVALEEEQFGLHTFYVRAIDFEGNFDPTPAEHTWRLLGIMTSFTGGPGFTPGETPFEPATGGPTLSNDATITFEANVADADFECSLDLEPFEPCESPVEYENLMMGEHLLRVLATSSNPEMQELEPAEYEWEVLEPPTNEPPTVTIERAPGNNSSSTFFEFVGIDDLTPPELLIYECRLDSTSNLDWEECTSPFNLLDRWTYDGGGAGEALLSPGQHKFEVRAVDNFEPAVENPNFPEAEGNAGPPTSHTWTMATDTSPPGTSIFLGPNNGEKVGLPESLFEFTGTDNATPILQLEYECRVDNFPLWEPCDSPGDASGLAPGHAHVPRARDRPRRERRPDACHADVGARRGPDHDVQRRAAGPGHHGRPGQRDPPDDREHGRARDLPVRRRPGAERDLRVRARRGGLPALHLAARSLGPARQRHA